MREPWQRAMSDYSYILIKPGTQHLSPEQNLTQIFPTDVFTFAMSPGIPNCATKMLNGFQCGETVDLTDYHIDVAKQVLSKILFVGITENFKESVCLFSWLYGGEASPLHMQKTRQTPHLGSRSMQDVLSPQQRILFNAAYKYDIELYRFARELFMNRYHLTGCAISES